MLGGSVAAPWQRRKEYHQQYLAFFAAGEPPDPVSVGEF